MKLIASWLLSIACATLFFVAASATASAQPNSNTGATWGEITGDRVNIRCGASANHASLKSANKGDKFVIIGEQSGWAKLQMTAEIECYVSAQYVQASGNVGIVTASTVNLRAQATTEGSVIGKLSRGEQVQIVSTTKEWTRIVPPIGAAMFVQGSFIRGLGAVTQADFETYRLKGAAAVGNIPNAPAPVQSRTDVASSTTVDSQKPRLPAGLKSTYDQLVARYDDALAGEGSSDLQGLEDLAIEFSQFASACGNTEYAALAQNQAKSLMAAKSRIEMAIRKAEEDRKAALVAAEAKAAELMASQKLTQQEEAKTRMLSRLLYAPKAEYTATGMIADTRDEKGRRIFLLVQNKQVLFRLELSPETANVDLRELWNRNVGVKGKVVTIEGEKYSVLVLSQIDAK